MMVGLLKFRQTIFGLLILGALGHIIQVFTEKGFWSGFISIFITAFACLVLKYVIDLLFYPITLYLIKKNSFEERLKEISKTAYKKLKDNEKSKSSLIDGREYNSKD